MAAPAPWKLLTALWTVYLVWGSTYLAIKVSVRTLPAFLSAGSRFLLAGVLLALILALRGRSIRITRRELASSALLGIALLGLGVGLVTFAETRIDSGIAAMIAGTVPLQVILLRTLARERVALATRLSVLVGLAGLALIVIPGGEGASSAVGLAIALGRDDLLVARLLLRAPAAAAARRLRRDDLGDAERRRLPAPARRRHRRARRRWTRQAFTLESIAAWLYLAVFGSLIGFTAYAWLLRNAPISKVVTHQYVNPLVAILLGALVLDEQLTLAIGVGAALIVGSVFVAVRQERAYAPSTCER